MPKFPAASSRKDDRKEQILDVALRAFSESGYRGVSLADIAKRCGLSQAGLLHHFGSKAGLLAAVMEYRDQVNYYRMGFDEQLDAIGYLDRLVRLVEHNVHVPQLVRLFTLVTSEAVTSSHPAHEWAVHRYRDREAHLSQLLAAGVADGSLRDDVDAASVASQVYAMMDGLQIQWLLDPDRVDMASLFRACVADLTERIRS